jgi:hypothetical protein
MLGPEPQTENRAWLARGTIRPGVVLRVLPDFLPVAGTLGRPRALLRQFRGHEAEASDWTGLIPPPRAS